MEAHVGDFGLAKLIDISNSRTMSAIAGSYGYIAPGKICWTLRQDLHLISYAVFHTDAPTVVFQLTFPAINYKIELLKHHVWLLMMCFL
jgi:hypothetical protein